MIRGSVRRSVLVSVALANLACDTFEAAAPGSVDGGSDAGPDRATIVCNAPTVVCGTACADLAVDQRNCGRCGRSCGGAACTNGECEAETVGQTDASIDVPVGVAVDDNNVYVTTWPASPTTPAESAKGRVLYKPKSQPAEQFRVLGTDQAMPEPIVVAADRVVWASWYSGGAVRSARVSSDSVSRRIDHLTGTSGFFAGASFGTLAYFSKFDAVDGRILSVDVTLEPGDAGALDAGGTGTVDSSVLVVGGQAEPRGVAVDGERVYWAHKTGIRAKAKAAGSTVEDYVSGLQLGDAVAVSDGFVYYTDRDQGILGRVPATGKGASETIARGLVSPRDMVVSGDSVYVAELGASRISEVRISTRKTRSLVVGLRSPKGLAKDGQFLYWTDSGTGRVSRLGL
jgi:sugar lactone lactonase YvrE